MSIRATLRLFASHPTATLTPLAPRTKLTTTLTGLLIHPSPLPALLTTYADTLHLLSTIPATSVYRQSVESITNERKSIIEKFELKFQGVGGEEAIEAVETEVGMGCVEELLVMAKDELVLVGKMLEWKPWEELEVKAQPGQWEQFGITPSTTTAEELVKRQQS